MIKTFRCRETERLYARRPSLRFRHIERAARRKLRQLNAARELRDLAAPPGNRLEALKGGRQRQHGIHINDRWRLCFIWRDGDAYDVQIVDYH